MKSENPNMSKKRLFFLLFSMNVGGVEKSLLGLLDTLSPEEYEVHVGLLQRKGGFLGMLPEWVVLHDCCRGGWDMLHEPPLQIIMENVKNAHFVLAIRLLFGYLVYKMTKDWTIYYNAVLKNEEEIECDFDAAYAYAGPATIIDYYICRKIRAKEKYGWIHFDVTRVWIDRKMTSQLYKEYKKIFIVSETAKMKFDAFFPEFRNKTEVRYNIVSKEKILFLSKSGNTFDDNFEGVRILTVGRLSKEKGQDVTVIALKKLVEKSMNVKWYYVGDGDLLQQCKQLAKEEGVDDRTVFLGLCSNPYGYMRDCDIYVQPSRHEGYCITLEEARCFNVPIVATDFAGAKEQLTTYSAGKVVGFSAEDIANGIISLLGSQQ